MSNVRYSLSVVRDILRNDGDATDVAKAFGTTPAGAAEYMRRNNLLAIKKPKSDDKYAKMSSRDLVDELINLSSPSCNCPTCVIIREIERRERRRRGGNNKH